MKSLKISFPLVHKRSSLPTLCIFLAILGCLPILMVMWVALCSQFTRVEGTNETVFYNVYICIRAIFALALLAGVTVFDLRRASVALLPAAVLGVISSAMKLIIDFSAYTNKKALAQSLSMHPSYTQNYIDIAQAGLVFITCALVLVYILGLLKTGFPVILSAVASVIIILYSVISYATIYTVSGYTLFVKIYTVPLTIGAILFCLSSKTRAQIEGKAKKEKYVPRRMRK